MKAADREKGKHMKAGAFKVCVTCAGSGVCGACKGTGKTGFLLHRPPASARPCWRCHGSGACDSCQGKGEVRSFHPHILVMTSLQRPTSISVAAFSGAGWRYIRLPEDLIGQPLRQQRDWVSGRVASHFRDERGLCLLFGIIVGYRWRLTDEIEYQFNVHGELLDVDGFDAYLASTDE